MPTDSTARCAGSAGGTRRRRKEARPQELLEAALDLFAEKGFAATRSEEVAARAGVSKGTLYLYFPSKEELFKAVVRSRLVPLIAEGRGIADGFDGHTADLLRMLLLRWWERVGLTPAGGITKIVIAEACNFPDLAQFYFDEVVLPAQRLLTQTLQRGIARGEFRTVPPVETFHALVAPALFMAMHRHSLGACPLRGRPDCDDNVVIATHIDLVLEGLRARPLPQPSPARP